MSDEITVVVADDHPMYREGVIRAIAQWPRIRVVAEAPDGRAALDAIRTHAPRVALVDLQLPDMDAVRVVDALKRDESPTQVLVISASEDDETVYRVFAAGARGFLPKLSTADEICRAIELVASGGAVIPPHIAGGLVGEIHKRRDRDDQPLLTEREREILRLSADGLSVQKCADHMHLSAATVKTHLQHAYEKLGVSDRTAAVAKALRGGLLD